MSGIGATGGGQVGKAAETIKNAAKEAAKAVGTGPTPIEKKVSEAVVEAVKDAAHSVSHFVQSPEGTAITAGVLLKATIPFSLLGDAFIFGGAACAAVKYMEKHNPELTKSLAKDAMIGAAGAAIAAVNPVAGTVMLAAAAADATVNVAHEAEKAVATGSAAKAGKSLGKAAAEGVAKAAEAAKKK